MYSCDVYFFTVGTTSDLQLDDTALPLTPVIDRDFEKCSLKNSISAGLQSSGKLQFFGKHSLTSPQILVNRFAPVLGILCPAAPVNIPNSLSDPSSTQLNHFSPVTSPLMNSSFLSTRFQDQIDVSNTMN